jgi:3-hydroxyisobutyrate dehydrogenase-like beta-hydroxyacid dehydrogenase
MRGQDEGASRSGAPVAMVGLGRMGRAMVERLRAHDIEVVAWNRTRSVADSLAATSGCHVAATAREAAEAADIVLQCLADDAALLEVCSGPDGVNAGLRAGTVLVDMSTVDPRTITGLAPAVAERGAVLLDAPVSGSVPAVAAGALTIMVGGDGIALERVRGTLEVLGSRIFHLGPSGAGAAMKLVVNGVIHALNISLAEALVMAERCAVERETAWDVLTASAAGAPFLNYKRAAFLAPEVTEPAFILDLVAKDLRLITELAERVGIEAGQARANRAIAERANEAGHGARDMSWLAQVLREG